MWTCQLQSVREVATPARAVLLCGYEGVQAIKCLHTVFDFGWDMIVEIDFKF